MITNIIKIEDIIGFKRSTKHDTGIIVTYDKQGTSKTPSLHIPDITLSDFAIMYVMAMECYNNNVRDVLAIAHYDNGDFLVMDFVLSLYTADELRDFIIYVKQHDELFNNNTHKVGIIQLAYKHLERIERKNAEYQQIITYYNTHAFVPMGKILSGYTDEEFNDIIEHTTNRVSPKQISDKPEFIVYLYHCKEVSKKIDKAYDTYLDNTKKENYYND